jgi:hypothetical protein
MGFGPLLIWIMGYGPRIPSFPTYFRSLIVVSSKQNSHALVSSPRWQRPSPAELKGLLGREGFYRHQLILQITYGCIPPTEKDFHKKGLCFHEASVPHSIMRSCGHHRHWEAFTNVCVSPLVLCALIRPFNTGRFMPVNSLERQAAVKPGGLYNW